MTIVRRRRARLIGYGVLCLLPLALLCMPLLRSAPEPERAALAKRGEAIASSSAAPIQAAKRATTASLSGTVTGSKGEPLAAATVCASCAACNVYLPDTPRICSQTDGAGRYALRDLSVSDYLVSASAAGHVAKLANGGKPVAISQRGLATLDVSLDEGGAVVAGVVMDVTGGTVAGATVQSISGTEEHDSIRVTQSTKSDEQGRFELTCPAGHVALLAMADGYATGFASRTAPASDVELFVAPSSSIQGVVATDQGQPISGLRVIAHAPGTLIREATSDASGHFTLTGLSSGVYQLRASGDGWLGDYPATVPLSTADSVGDVLITVRKAAAVRGTLLNADNEPCALGRVHIGPGPRAYSVPILEAISASDGSVSFDAVPAGAYEVSIACNDGETQPAQPLEVGSADRTGLVWKIAPQLSIEGHVINARGQPVSKLMVELRTENAGRIMARSATSGPDGAFAFQGLAVGAYSLRSPELDEETPVQLGEWSVTGLRLRAKATGYVEVHVTAGDGKPVDGLSISASGASGGQAQQSALPEELGNGRYRLGPLQVGSYAVYVGDGVNPRVRAGGPSGETQVRDGETIELAVEYGRYQGRISGRVVDELGAPVENVWVQARPMTSAQDPLAEVQQMTVISESRRSLTDLDGRFELDELAQNGTFFVTAEWPLGGQAKVEGVRADSTIELVLQQLGSLAGTAVDPNGQPVAHLSLQISNTQTGQQRTEVFSDPAGKWQLDRVTPGSIQLIANDPNGHVSVTTLNVAPKQSLPDISLRLEPRYAAR